MRAVTACLLVLLPVGCFSSWKPSYVVTKTGAAGVAKAANCDFLIATSKVDRPYDEIAILDAKMWAEDAASFKQTVAAQVCEIGGDAVIAEVNGNGRYVRGTVLRWKDAEAAR
jgi:hypothetical protein